MYERGSQLAGLDFPVKSVRFVENCFSSTNFPNIGKAAYESNDFSSPMQEFDQTKAAQRSQFCGFLVFSILWCVLAVL